MISRSRTTQTLGLALILAASPFVVSPRNIAQAQVPTKDAFAREPKTPLEMWEAATYLLRVGSPELAAPFVKKFLDANPDDQTLLDVRDDFGAGSVLMLSDYPETRAYAKPLAEKLAEASKRHATDPERIDKFVALLSKSRPEQNYAVERLRESGPYAIPPLIKALSVTGLDPTIRSSIAENLGRLDRKAVPALIATLDSNDDPLVGDVARALGRIGDARAIPALTFVAARTNPESAAKPLVIQAIEALTGKPFASQPRTPVRVLSDEARNYHTHAYKFPGDPVTLWLWDDAEKVPKPESKSVKDAEALLGLRAAKEALEIDPTDIEAKVNQISLGLAYDPAEWKAPALESGPEILGKVVRLAIADGRSDLATVATSLLGEISKREDLKADRSIPLTDALFAPDRRVQFAAAEALVKLEPKTWFLGSSRVVPVLARFVAAQSVPRALIVDGNAERASQVAGYFREAGYDSHVASTGAKAFAEAVLEADIEVIVIDPYFINDRWTLADLLGNLKADARTAGIPVLVVGPLKLERGLAKQLESFPNVRFLVTPSETRLLKIQLDRTFASLKVRPMTEAERAEYAKKASTLISEVAKQPRSPFENDLASAEPLLALALNGPIAPIEAATALGDIPGTDAQQSLADVALDPSKEEPVRMAVARELTRNIRRFGPKLEGSQERRLVDELAQEADPKLRDALAAIVGALKGEPDASQTKPSTYRASAR
jgi:HEAT repeat protein